MTSALGIAMLNLSSAAVCGDNNLFCFRINNLAGWILSLLNLSSAARFALLDLGDITIPLFR